MILPQASGLTKGGNMDEAQFRPLKKGDLCNPILQEAMMHEFDKVKFGEAMIRRDNAGELRWWASLWYERVIYLEGQVESRNVDIAEFEKKLETWKVIADGLTNG